MAMDDAVLKLMDQYDFNSKINITMIFDDSDDEQKPDIKVNEETNSNCENNIMYSKRCAEDITTKSFKKLKDRRNEERDRIDKDSDKIKNIETTMQIDTHCNTNGNISCDNIGSQVNNSFADAPTEKNIMTTSCQGPSPQINEKSSNLSTLIMYELDILSKNIVTIITAYYKLRPFRKRPDVNEKTVERAIKTFSLIKYYYFRASYSTMIKMIRPQENNEEIITTLIDKILELVTRKKSFYTLVTRLHVQPLIDEFLSWINQEKERLERLKIDQQAMRDNCILKQQAQTSQLPSYDSLFTTNNNPKPTGITPNSTCIFSAGTADGREIRINTSLETYTQRNRVCNNNLNNIQSNHMPENMTTHSVPYHIPPNPINNNYYQLPPPHYNSIYSPPPNYNCISPQNSPNQYYCHNVPPPTDYQFHTYTAPPANNHKLRRERKKRTNTNVISNAQTMIPNDTIPTTTCIMCGKYLEQTVSNQYMYCSLLCQLGGTVENTRTPVISSVHSLNPNILPKSAPFCSMCGKFTEHIAYTNGHNVYCSLLCKELNASNHQTFT